MGENLLVPDEEGVEVCRRPEPAANDHSRGKRKVYESR